MKVIVFFAVSCIILINCNLHERNLQIIEATTSITSQSSVSSSDAADGESHSSISSVSTSSVADRIVAPVILEEA